MTSDLTGEILSDAVTSGIEAADRYLDGGYRSVVGMSSRFAGGVCSRLMAIQNKLGVTGHIAEIGAFEGRFLIALAHCLGKDEMALGIDVFTWPDEGLMDRFNANCAKHGLAKNAYRAWKADSRQITPDMLMEKVGGGGRIRLFHIDGEHKPDSLKNDLELASQVMTPGGLIILDDMLHPGYPTLMVTVHEYLARHPEMLVLCVIDRTSIVAATKFVLCEADWYKRYEAELLEALRPYFWPMGSDFISHWCAVLSTDMRLAKIV